MVITFKNASKPGQEAHYIGETEPIVQQLEAAWPLKQQQSSPLQLGEDLRLYRPRGAKGATELVKAKNAIFAEDDGSAP